MFNYDISPTVEIKKDCDSCCSYKEIYEHLKKALDGKHTKNQYLVLECYPGVREEELLSELINKLEPAQIVKSEEYKLPEEEIRKKIEYNLTDDRVFGIMSHFSIADFLDLGKVEAFKASKPLSGLTIIYGTGASLLCSEPDLLVYCDITRWEIQRRYRTHENGNWLLDNKEEDTLKKYKCGYFIEWRSADRLKRELFNKIDFWLDTNVENQPKMLSGDNYTTALKETAQRPFRLVPYFDESVWGGQWMREKFKLSGDVSNFGWAFDGVPEENSIGLKFGDMVYDSPAVNLVFMFPDQLLGPKVHSRFGREFPIRFDYLDTMGGGNLSLQVHPLVEYIQDKFGMHYTQDESYYILESTEQSSIYLGTKEGVTKEELFKELRLAESGKQSFPDEKFINNFKVKKHEHYSIPAGTIHCGGNDTVVLEISATPYIFTFKLWDWDRVGLDGKPRPVHLNHGEENVQINRDTHWVKDNLMAGPEMIREGDGFTEESTGLSELEFIETRRIWFDKEVQLQTHDSVNMLNLVEGEAAIVFSLDDAFEPYEVHYGETFIVPASVQKYGIKPAYSTTEKLGLIQAFVRV